MFLKSPGSYKNRIENTAKSHGDRTMKRSEKCFEDVAIRSIGNTLVVVSTYSTYVLTSVYTSDLFRETYIITIVLYELLSYTFYIF